MKLSAAQNDILRQITLVVLFVIDIALVVNMYLGLGDSWEKFVILAAALAIVGLKIQSLLNGVRQYAKFKKFKKKEDTSSSNLYRGKSVRSYLVYSLCAVLTVGGSLMFTVTSVDRMDQVATAQTSTNEDAIRTKKELVAGYKETIAENQDAIASNEKELTKENLPTWMVSQLTVANTKARALNSSLREKISIASEEILKLQAEGSKVVIQGTAKKTIYARMGEILKISSKIIALILLGLLSLLIEVGILYTSNPTEIEDIEDLEKESPPEEVETVVLEKKRAYTRRKKATIVDDVEKADGHFLEEKPEELEFFEVVEEKEVPSESSSKPLPTREVKSEAIIEETPIIDPPVERPIMNAAEKFIHALLSNGTRPFLKDKKIAAEEAGMNLIEATDLFTKLSQERGNKGYPLIEFRKSQWYPNFSSEYIIALLSERNIIKK